MAVAARTDNFAPNGANLNVAQHAWAALANGDSGAPLSPADFDRLAVQVVGTFGAGGTIVLEGSSELVPTTWATLKDIGGVAISLTAAGIAQVQQLPLWVRPRVTAGDGTTALVVTATARRSRI